MYIPVTMPMSLVYFDRGRNNVVPKNGRDPSSDPIKGGTPTLPALYSRKASLVSRKFPNSRRLNTTQQPLLSLLIQSLGWERARKNYSISLKSTSLGLHKTATMWLSSALYGFSLVACAYAGVSDQTTTDDDGIRSIPV